MFLKNHTVHNSEANIGKLVISNKVKIENNNIIGHCVQSLTHSVITLVAINIVSWLFMLLKNSQTVYKIQGNY